MLDLSQSYIRKELAAQIVKDIDAYAVATYDDGDRKHLGASVVGKECTREVWYSWRWFGGKKTSGRMQRLFQRGHLEELRFLEYLTGIGCTVWSHNPETGKQFRVEKLGGHFGGSLDAIIKLPTRYGVTDDVLFLGEFKTKGTGAGFTKLKEQGIMLQNPQHYDQMCTYGANYGYTYAIYFSVNKNDDDLHCEVVPLNAARAAEVEKKAAYIITSQTPPPRIAMTETFWKCKGCDYVGPCHRNEIPAKNCRSCVNAVPTPVGDGQWQCKLYGVIPPHVIPVGCAVWEFIK